MSDEQVQWGLLYRFTTPFPRLLVTKLLGLREITANRAGNSTNSQIFSIHCFRLIFGSIGVEPDMQICK